MTAPTDTPPVETKESMGIDPYERNWIRLSLIILVLFFGLIALAGFALGFQVPGEEVRVDPQTVTDSGPFADPGLREIAPGEYEAYLVSRTFVFQPNELTVPVGSTIKFYVTSVDVQHGFKLQDTNVNMQIVPGQVSVLEATFDEIGEYPYICHEYCGIGHAAMFGTLRVVPPGQE
ncbi:MAG: cytochrome C oxidase subunit II [Acidimicrobiia bacterium]|nr:cytochrome c oxidase subunit II [Acidimicrobiia bacterium]NNK91682.1 cytochrome C oxidase subunit II [Acidimicrobiia bacterium]